MLIEEDMDVPNHFLLPISVDVFPAKSLNWCHWFVIPITMRHSMMEVFFFFFFFFGEKLN